jgi:hypothetical protein
MNKLLLNNILLLKNQLERIKKAIPISLFLC